jgi:uncharacterized membrane protein
MGRVKDQEGRMAQLVVLGLESPARAEKVFDLAGDLAKQELLQLEDAAPSSPTTPRSSRPT